MVKRYDLFKNKMYEDPEGDYVSFAEYEAQRQNTLELLKRESKYQAVLGVLCTYAEVVDGGTVIIPKAYLDECADVLAMPRPKLNTQSWAGDSVKDWMARYKD